MMRSEFEVVKDRPEEPLVIRDVGHERQTSVTNDAEAVVRFLVSNNVLKGRRLFYYDSDDSLDEIVVVDGRFAGFRPGPR